MRKRLAGFTLVELMIVVAILGVLAALAIYGSRKYLAAAKTGEARNTVGAIARTAAVQYELERSPSEMLVEGSVSAKATHVLCKSADAVPDNLDKVRGRKYQPDKMPGIDFGIGSNLIGWNCLNFAISNPIYYQYDYNQGSEYIGMPLGGPDPGPDGFEASAMGDLDGDNTESVFARAGIPVNGEIKLTTQVFADDEFE
jgi:type IV pilus assembly protein PilA